MPRGVLRIYLGAAPGVGKTFAMLDEGWRRHQRGTDVVVGYVETHGRPRTEAQLRDLEVVPRRRVQYRGSTFEEMDVAAVLDRRPKVALVDELAHTNVPGAGNEKRWQDIDDLLAAGIDVITTVNIQHLESLNDVIATITDITQHETVPDAFVRAADQIELVDMSPEALRRRMAHGNIYPAEKIDAALGNYFRPGNLGALREMALLWVADRVEDALRDYQAGHGIDETWETRERVVVALTGRPSDEQLVRRAARLAGRLRGDLVAVHVVASDGLAKPTVALDQVTSLLVELGGSYHEVAGDDIADAIVQFAETERATQLVVGAPRRRRFPYLSDRPIVARVLRRVRTADVHVITTASAEGAAPRRTRILSPLPRRRRWLGWLVAGIGTPLLAAAMLPLRARVDLSTVLLAFLALAAGCAAVGGAVVGLATAIVAFTVVDVAYIEPYWTLTIRDPEELVALVLFLGVTGLVAGLVDVAARRHNEALLARRHADILARSTATLVSDADPVPQILEHIRTTFGYDQVAVSGPAAPTLRAGRDATGTPTTIPLRGATTDPGRLELHGPPPSAADLQVLRTIADQIAVALEARRLQAQAETAEQLAGVDALRTALLQAVSHDLRTPLAAIKAYVSGLRSPDVRWTPAQLDEVHAAIDNETDRLDHLVGNLLDASRLQSGTLAVSRRPTPVEDVLGPALAGLDPTRLTIDVGPDIPLIDTDPALAERALANLVGNALRYSPEDRGVRVEVKQVGNRVHLRVTDRGPGIPRAERDLVFEPFQRLDDSSGHGIGLGLAITRGFVHAVGGTIDLDDTPGGGLTVVVTLPTASTGSGSHSHGAP